ncbi:hypothetical protein [Salipiger abyssi]|uniref:hypothetical protein n=1 Tax=Salipiger abyssi TaxID=1250539 RepID=UPI001A8FB359|nr:hypothetical protein [Salipiger abyssi]MBN9890161.1 hypothetical protein [Salipiger abyssi]
MQKLVRAFAEDKTVKQAAQETGFSEVTARNVFMKLREHLYRYGFMRLPPIPGRAMPARIVFAKKHRGVPEKYAHLYETEFLHRVYFTKNGRAVKRFSARDPKAIPRVKKLLEYNKVTEKYDVIEQLERLDPETGQRETRPFDPIDFETSSTIIVNELNLEPSEAFFRYLWGLLLKIPL